MKKRFDQTKKKKEEETGKIKTKCLNKAQNAKRIKQ
jgi:hypothetical protein